MKNPIRNLKFPVWAAAAALYIGFYNATAPACALELTPAEEKKLLYCEAGIAELNPEIATECLDEKWVLDTLAEQDPDRSVRLLRRANILKDLSAVLDVYTQPDSMRMALAIRIGEGFPPSELGIGPEPEKFLEWAKTRKPEKVALVRAAIRPWELIEAKQKEWFRSQGLSAEIWERLTLAIRNQNFCAYADAEARELLKTTTVPDRKTLDTMRQLASAVNAELLPGTRTAVSEHINRLSSIIDAKEKAAALLTTDPKKLRDFQNKLAEIEGLPLEDQTERLNRFFENTPDLKNSGITLNPHPVNGETQANRFTDSERQAISAGLKTALLAEIAGTRAGDKTLDFYKRPGNALSVSLTSAPGIFGKFSQETGEIVFGEESIRQWLSAGGYNEKNLLSSPAAIKELAAFLSPVLVHEAVHQRQTAWAEAGKMKKIYPQEYEIEAASTEALYIIEKIRKDRDFAAMLASAASGYNKEKAQRGDSFFKDPREFKRSIQDSYYPDLPSFETYASNILLRADELSAEIKRREKLPQKEQDRFEKMGYGTMELTVNGRKVFAQPSQIKTSVLKKWVMEYLHWYSEGKDRITREAEWINDAYKTITKDGKQAGRSAMKPVPSPVPPTAQ